MYLFHNTKLLLQYYNYHDPIQIMEACKWFHKDFTYSQLMSFILFIISLEKLSIGPLGIERIFQKVDFLTNPDDFMIWSDKPLNSIWKAKDFYYQKQAWMCMIHWKIIRPIYKKCSLYSLIQNIRFENAYVRSIEPEVINLEWEEAYIVDNGTSTKFSKEMSLQYKQWKTAKKNLKKQRRLETLKSNEPKTKKKRQWNFKKIQQKKKSKVIKKDIQTTLLLEIQKSIEVWQTKVQKYLNQWVYVVTEVKKEKLLTQKYGSLIQKWRKNLPSQLSLMKKVLQTKMIGILKSNEFEKRYTSIMVKVISKKFKWESQFLEEFEQKYNTSVCFKEQDWINNNRLSQLEGKLLKSCQYILEKFLEFFINDLDQKDDLWIKSYLNFLMKIHHERHIVYYNKVIDYQVVHFCPLRIQKILPSKAYHSILKVFKIITDSLIRCKQLLFEIDFMCKIIETFKPLQPRKRSEIWLSDFDIEWMKKNQIPFFLIGTNQEDFKSFVNIWFLGTDREEKKSTNDYGEKNDFFAVVEETHLSLLPFEYRILVPRILCTSKLDQLRVDAIPEKPSILLLRNHDNHDEFISSE